MKKLLNMKLFLNFFSNFKLNNLFDYEVSKITNILIEYNSINKN